MAEVGDFMRHDDVAVRVDGSLQVVAGKARALAVRRHGARVRVGQRDLAVGRSLDLARHGLQLAHLPAERLYSLVQARRAHLGDVHLLPIGSVELVQVALDARLDLRQVKENRGSRIVLVARVHGLEPAAVHRHHPAGDQANLPAQDDELLAGGTDSLAVVAPEVRDWDRTADLPRITIPTLVRRWPATSRRPPGEAEVGPVGGVDQMGQWRAPVSDRRNE